MFKLHKNVSRCLMNQEPSDLTKDQLKLIFGNLRMILSMSKKKKIMHVWLNWSILSWIKAKWIHQTRQCIANSKAEAIITTKSMGRIKEEAIIEAEAVVITEAEEVEVEVTMARVRTNLVKMRILNSSNKICLNSNNMAITNQWVTNSKRWVFIKHFLLVSSQLSSRATKCSRIQWLNNSRWASISRFQSKVRLRCCHFHSLMLAPLISFKVTLEEHSLVIAFMRPSKEYTVMNSPQSLRVLSLMRMSLISRGSSLTISTSLAEFMRLISFWSLQRTKDKLQNSRPSNEIDFHLDR